MGKWVAIVVISLAAVVLTWLLAHARYRQMMVDAQTVWDEIAQTARPDLGAYHPDMVADLPEIARRYFQHAIAAGTPLLTRVEVTMTGEFLLGARDAQQGYAMQARQILAPPSDFVWIAAMSKGLLRINGSDGLHKGAGWTRFWVLQSLPLVLLADTDDLNRAAAARPAIEAIWAPATLLPMGGAEWLQTGPDTAEVTFGVGNDALTLRLWIAQSGAVTQVLTQRWSDVNPAKTYQLQPFGGTIDAEATFGGFTIPAHVTIGNHFGTADYLPFFQAQIETAAFF